MSIDKESIVRNLYWDQKVDPVAMLDKIRGAVSVSEKEKTRIFVRCFESLPWHLVVGLWGIDECRRMWSPDIRKMIRPQLRGKYDRIYAFLRGRPVSVSEQDVENRRRTFDAFLSHRCAVLSRQSPAVIS